MDQRALVVIRCYY